MRKLFILSLGILLIFLYPEVKAFYIQTNDDPTKPGKKTARPDVPGDLIIDVGFNFLLDQTENMNTGFWGSKIINVYYYRHFGIGESNFSINIGLGAGMEKLSFEDGTYTMGIDADGNTEMVELPGTFDVKKSKLALNYVDLPIEFRFHTNKNHDTGFRAAIGGKVGYLLNNHTKLVYKEDGEKFKVKNDQDYNIEKIRYGLLGRLGFPGINVFCYYGLSSLFKSEKGPEGADASTWNIGISITGF